MQHAILQGPQDCMAAEHTLTYTICSQGHCSAMSQCWGCSGQGGSGRCWAAKLLPVLRQDNSITGCGAWAIPSGLQLLHPEAAQTGSSCSIRSQLLLLNPAESCSIGSKLLNSAQAAQSGSLTWQQHQHTPPPALPAQNHRHQMPATPHLALSSTMSTLEHDTTSDFQHHQ